MTDIEPHLQNAMYGTPEINPDEKHYYLGTFKERVYMTQTMTTLGESKFVDMWAEQLHQHQDGLLLLNGRSDPDQLNPLMQLAQKEQVDFRLVNDPALVQSPLAVVLTADHAVNQEQIKIENIPAKTSTVENKKMTVSKPWYRRLFK